jgi:hypothetical protein
MLRGSPGHLSHDENSPTLVAERGLQGQQVPFLLPIQGGCREPLQKLRGSFVEKQLEEHGHSLSSPEEMCLHLELDNSTFRIWLLRISPHSDAFSDASQKGHVVKHVWENLAEAENLAESLGKSGPRAARAPIGFNPQNPQDGGSTLQVELTGNS